MAPDKPDRRFASDRLLILHSLRWTVKTTIHQPAVGLTSLGVGLARRALVSATTALRTLATVGRSLRIDRLIEAVVATTATGLALFSEGLSQPGTDLFSSHLNQAQRCHLGNLVSGTIPPQTLSEATHQKFTVGRQHHIDEVNDDNPANIAQS